MWREKILDRTVEATFHDGASDTEIGACEAALGQSLPRELAELLRETNGVQGEYGLGLIWAVQRIAADNVRFRGDEAFARLYLPFGSLLFFADAGNGDQFAFVIRERPGRGVRVGPRDRQPHLGSPELGHLPAVVAQRNHPAVTRPPAGREPARRAPSVTLNRSASLCRDAHPTRQIRAWAAVA